jgi:MFS family permease
MAGGGEGSWHFEPHQRPVMLGSPWNPDHPALRKWGYLASGILIGITGGLSNALITANLAYVQGSLGLGPEQAAMLPAVYVMTNVCANLVLIKCRQQFGLQRFMQWALISYALVTLAHLFVHTYWAALLVRAASGIAAGGLTTLCILTLMQAMPAAKRPAGVLIGIAVPQLALPVARIMAPSLIEWGDWHMAYVLELGLTLLTLAALMLLPLPPSERERKFEKTDLLTIALFFPAIGLLCAVLGLGRINWWTDASWIAYALIGAILLLTAGFLLEGGRTNPMLVTRWLTAPEVVRIGLVAVAVRILVSEQTFGSVGLLSAVGMGTDQFRTLYIFVTLASIAGMAASVLTFDPANPGRAIQIACALIAIGAFMDAGATNLTRPANLYLSQSLIGFGALMFIGPAMLIGISRMMLSSQNHFISWVVLFGATQNLGGLIGSAGFGTFQTIREKFHSNEIVQNIVTTNPLAAQRLAAGAHSLSGTVADPALRGAEGAALLSLQATREANILAFNDVFLVIALLACLAVLWGVSIQLKMKRRGEPSPVLVLGRAMAAAASAKQPDPKARGS